jgi:nucleotide-binding universal stress UspA family protein
VTRILVGIDGSEGSKAALRWACDEASTSRAATVVATAVWFSTPPVVSPWLAGSMPPIDLSDSTIALLDSTISAVAETHNPSFVLERRVIQGPPAPTLLYEAERCDLIVVGTRGLGGFQSLVLGSVSHHLVNHARCPVVVIPRPDELARKTVSRAMVVGVDGSENSIAALQWAGRRAGSTGSTLRATFVWRSDRRSTASRAEPSEDATTRGALRVLEDALAKAKLPAGIAIEHNAIEGDVAPTLIAESHDAELLVVGARGHGGFAGLLLGSTANAVTHHPPCPVAVIRVY